MPCIQIIDVSNRAVISLYSLRVVFMFYQVQRIDDLVVWGWDGSGLHRVVALRESVIDCMCTAICHYVLVLILLLQIL
jgi:hypothetical protein